MSHQPVMLKEMLGAMAPKAGEIYVDGTFGAGGYSRALLESADCKVIALDRDEEVAALAEKLAHQFPDRFIFILGRFGDMEDLLRSHGITSIDGVVLDIGVSSMQLETPERGFSFQHDAPLTMQMGSGGGNLSWLLHHASEKELADIIYTLGGERKSRMIARAIVAARQKEPLATTGQLSAIIGSAVGKYHDTINPSTRTFQAFRIWVNDELGELEKGLLAAEQLLKPGGRLVVVTFHSLEDQIVKQFLTIRSGKTAKASRHLPAVEEQPVAPAFYLPFRKGIRPSEKEVAENPRARSATLRAGIRTATSMEERL